MQINSIFNKGKTKTKQDQSKNEKQMENACSSNTKLNSLNVAVVRKIVAITLAVPINVMLLGI